jgi:hypothetical protein
MMECIDSDPEQLAPSQEVSGWSLTPAAFAAIDAFPRESICNPVAPEFMAPPDRETDGAVAVSVGQI